MGIDVSTDDGVAEVVIDYPPVNALPVQGWFDLAAAVTAAGADSGVRVVVLAAAGRGFCAGVDIKEIQRGSAGAHVGTSAADGSSAAGAGTDQAASAAGAGTGQAASAAGAGTGQAASAAHAALIGANRGCFAAFAAVYECAVPVIAAVQGFCLGGGVGLAGNADIVIAADDATFGLPEVDRGALGAATHLSRLVPQQLMRTMVYTCRSVPAAQLHAFGTVLDVVPAGRLREAARSLAREIAAKDGQTIRLAKQSLNGIDPVDVRRSYRYEQGFTYELNLAGVSHQARQAFVDRPSGRA